MHQSTSTCAKRPRLPVDNNDRIEKFFNLIKINMSDKIFIDACVKLVTVNARPFSIFDDSGMKDIIDPIMNAIKVTVNRTNIKDYVRNKATEIKNTIKSEIHNKLISIKIESATRLGRSIIGINAQYIQNQKIILRTLDMHEVENRQTGLYIKNVIIKVLESFDLKLHQIYSITSDSGRNMLKAAEFLMNEFQISDSDEELCDENATLFEDEDYVLATLHPNIIHIKCVAHTVQLAVQDTLSSSSCIKNNIDQIRKVCKKLRTPNMTNLAKKINLRKAILDCPTRWNSTYNMILRLLDYKTFCFDVMDPEFTLNDEAWEFCSIFIKVFTPVEKLTLKLQNEQMNFGDFYGLWLQFKQDLQNLKFESVLAANLYANVILRENNFITSKLLNVAIYMDPRFKLMLNDIQIVEAKAQIFKTIKILNNIQGNSIDIATCIIDTSTSSLDEGEDELEKLLQSRENTHQKVSQKNNSYNNVETAINNEIQVYENIPRISKEKNLIEFWEKHKLKMPLLYQAAQIILAVPATQVSVERAFSALKIVLSEQRAQLTTESLKNILFIKLNENFFNKNI